jgi:hypothetical protein
MQVPLQADSTTADFAVPFPGTELRRVLHVAEGRCVQLQRGGVKPRSRRTITVAQAAVGTPEM